MGSDFQVVKDLIIETSERDKAGELRPLVLYLGSMSEGKAISLLNFTLTMKDTNTTNLTEIVKLADRSKDLRHVCGLHAGVQRLSMQSWFSRLLSTPKVCNLFPSLGGFIDDVFADSRCFPFHLQPSAELARRSSREWRIAPVGHESRKGTSAARPKKPKLFAESLPQIYPYISRTAHEDCSLLLAIDDVVPKYLPNAVRADVCQDMIVAVLSGECSLDNLKSDLPKYMKGFYKMFPSKYGNVSMDAPIGFEDSKSTIGDLIRVNPARWRES